MRSSKPGKRTSAPVEIQNVSPRGLWILVGDREYFLPTDEFPWFRHATLDELADVRLHHGVHLRWPRLDVDLALDSLERLEAYPLRSRVPAPREGRRQTAR